MISSGYLRFLTLLLVLTAPAVWANNITISGAFDGSEPTMAADPVSCDGTPKRYRQIGTITVSATGSYQVIDAGNNFFFTSPAGGIADTVVMLYSTSFNAANPALNRVASVDEGETVGLNSGTSYVVVVQHWCEEMNGAFAVVIDGAGTISGAGFSSFSYTRGEFLGGSSTANFPGLGVRRFIASSPTSIFRSGTHYFGDLGGEINGNFMQLRVYQNAFDPNNPALNLVANTGDLLTSGFSLQAGTYVFVAIDIFESVDRFQFVLFPPGPFNFNPGLNGAWVAEGVGSQGIFMEVFQNLDILFFAHFTFVDQPPVQLDSGDMTLEASSGSPTKPQNHLGATEQIWLTAFGNIQDDSNFLTLKYENSTGGRFNASLPVATTNSNYGTGWIEGFSCSRLLINWTLPGGVVDTREYAKLLPDGVPYCESFIKAAPISPPF